MHTTRSTSFTMVVHLGTLPMQTTIGGFGESSMAAKRNVAPTIKYVDFINDDDDVGDM